MASTPSPCPSEALKQVTFGANDCVVSLFLLSTAPSATQIQSMCGAGAECAALLGRIRAAAPTECALASTTPALWLHRDVLDPVKTTCGGVFAFSSTRPGEAMNESGVLSSGISPQSSANPKSNSTASSGADKSTQDATAAASDAASAGGSMTTVLGAIIGVLVCLIAASIFALRRKRSHAGAARSGDTPFTYDLDRDDDFAFTFGADLDASARDTLHKHKQQQLIDDKDAEDHFASQRGSAFDQFAKSSGVRASHVVKPRTSSNMSRASTASLKLSTHSLEDDDDALAALTVLSLAENLWDDPAVLALRLEMPKLTLGECISSGAIAQVYSAQYDGCAVAVKRLVRERQDDAKQIDRVLVQATLQAALNHERIVRLVGIAWDALSNLSVVTEFAVGGDLRSMLARLDADAMPRGFTRDKVQIALHVAHALAYLHALHPVVLHHALTSSHVLLSADGDAKLTGVGRGCSSPSDGTPSSSTLWTAPEVASGQRADEKADVFAFGVVLSELDTQKPPYAHVQHATATMTDAAVLQLVVLGQARVEFSEQADADLVALAHACVAVDPRERPTAAAVVHRVDQVLRSFVALV